MKAQKNPQKNLVIFLWIKRGVAVVAVALWLGLMAAIFQGGGGMQEQAPKCIFTTMIIFGVLTAIYKGIDALERRQREEKQQNRQSEKV